MAPFVFTVIPSTFALLGIVMLKQFLRGTHSKGYQCYALTFPKGMSGNDVARWLRLIHAQLLGSFIYTPAAFNEVEYSVETGYVYRLLIPWDKTAGLIKDLSAAIPGAHWQQIPVPTEHWDKIVEFGTIAARHTLRGDAEEVTLSLLNKLAITEPGEKAMMQIPFSAQPVRSLPQEADTKDKLRDQREKLSELNFKGVVRLCVRADTPGRIKYLSAHLGSALKGFRTEHNQFVRRTAIERVLEPELQRAVNERIAPLVPTAHLNVSELAGLLAWPIGDPALAGMPGGRMRALPAPSSVPEVGIVTGRSTFQGRERNIALAWPDASMHTAIIGAPGQGKTELMKNIAYQYMNEGNGLFVIEKEGNFAQGVLDLVPEHRIDDVIYFDLTDRVRPVGYNPLDQGKPGSAVGEVMKVLGHQFGLGPWSYKYLMAGLLTITERPELGFADITTLLDPQGREEEQWAEEVIAAVKNPWAAQEWRRAKGKSKVERAKEIEPALNRIGVLTSMPELQHVFGQTKSGFDIKSALEENKIVVVNMKDMSSTAVRLAGSLFMDQLIDISKTTQKTRQTAVMVDEFADFMDLPINMDAATNQLRKYHIDLYVAFQYPSQLARPMLDAILNATATKIVMKLGAKDAKLITPELGSRITEQEIASLQKREAVARLMAPGGVSSAVTLKTLDAVRPTGFGREVRQRSRERYGVPVAVTQQEMGDRYKPSDAYKKASKRPDIGTAASS